MSKKSKVGRGALVRRLRREYGLTEAEARSAAEGGVFSADTPDDEATRILQQRKPQAPVEVPGEGPPEACTEVPAGTATESPAPADTRFRQGRRQLARLNVAALLLTGASLVTRVDPPRNT
jgi:hypothetical protein